MAGTEFVGKRWILSSQFISPGLTDPEKVEGLKP